jgi:hypothetical protein
MHISFSTEYVANIQACIPTDSVEIDNMSNNTMGDQKWWRHPTCVSQIKAMQISTFCLYSDHTRGCVVAGVLYSLRTGLVATQFS